MAINRTCLLQETDWNEEWKRLQQMREHADDVEFWDKRARTFGSETPSAYTREFIALADVRPGESILDMGCGTGNLAIPYAQDGHYVIAADFSQVMLEKTLENALRAGVTGIDTRQISWQEDWKAAGVAANSVDVAFASRSIATEDLRDALNKLSLVSRRRCCITLTTALSPHTDTRVLAACGIPNTHGRDFQYAFNILVNDGYLPECSYITSERKDTFDSMDEAFAKLDRMLVSALGEKDASDLETARTRLEAWLEANLVENEEAGESDGHHEMQKALRLRYNRQFTWAFISWDSSGAR